MRFPKRGLGARVRYRPRVILEFTLGTEGHVLRAATGNPAILPKDLGSGNLRELRALPQGRLFTHVMGKWVGRGSRGAARAGSVFADSCTEVSPGVSET